MRGPVRGELRQVVGAGAGRPSPVLAAGREPHHAPARCVGRERGATRSTVAAPSRPATRCGWATIRWTRAARFGCGREPRRPASFNALLTGVDSVTGVVVVRVTAASLRATADQARVRSPAGRGSPRPAAGISPRSLMTLPDQPPTPSRRVTRRLTATPAAAVPSRPAAIGVPLLPILLVLLLVAAAGAGVVLLLPPHVEFTNGAGRTGPAGRGRRSLPAHGSGRGRARRRVARARRWWRNGSCYGRSRPTGSRWERKSAGPSVLRGPSGTTALRASSRTGDDRLLRAAHHQRVEPATPGHGECGTAGCGGLRLRRAARARAGCSSATTGCFRTAPCRRGRGGRRVSVGGRSGIWGRR